MKFDTNNEVIYLIRLGIILERRNYIQRRNLVLKMAYVLIITKLQCFIESTLSEVKYSLKNSKKNKELHPKTRLFLVNTKLQSRLKTVQGILSSDAHATEQGLIRIKKHFSDILHSIFDERVISNNLDFNTKFPMGKTGSNDLIRLLDPLVLGNIFDITATDKYKYDSLLSRRHNIIHEDADPQLTPQLIYDYYYFSENFCFQIRKELQERLGINLGGL